MVLAFGEGGKLEVEARVAPSNAITKGAASTAAAILRPGNVVFCLKDEKNQQIFWLPFKSKLSLLKAAHDSQ